MPSALSAPHLHNEEAAYAWVEARLWPDGPVCPRCKGTERITALRGKSTRIGVRFCNPCRKPFTVKVGTVFESSHIPLRIWLQAIGLLCASKKGMSSNQLHRTLGITLKSAWFLSHRIGEAMASGDPAPMGGGGWIVEADESKLYGDALEHVAEHETVKHSAGEYVCGVKGPEAIHCNSAEGYFSIFKRGMKGIYQHCGERHLHRYLAEFDFRYNARVALGVNDGTRAERALRGVVGKRLTYRTTDRG